MTFWSGSGALNPRESPEKAFSRRNQQGWWRTLIAGFVPLGPCRIRDLAP